MSLNVTGEYKMQCWRGLSPSDTIVVVNSQLELYLFKKIKNAKEVELLNYVPDEWVRITVLMTPPVPTETILSSSKVDNE